MSRARQIAALAASEPGGALVWLDGGDGRGFVALEPDIEIVADDLEGLAAVEALWRAEPEFPWFGWLTYEVGTAALLGRPPVAATLPGLVLRRYRAALELGERERIVGDPRAGAALMARLERGSWPSGQSWPLGPVEAQVAADDYRARVRQAQAFIAAGETYQINLTQPFVAEWLPEWAGRPLAARAAAVYAALQAATPASMGALLAVETGRPCGRWVISNSPETLLAIELGAGEDGGDLARSWPIKGTRPRGSDPERDRAAQEALKQSTKDLAEHVMIVDLVRSDLGRLARPGSVRAPARPELVTLPTVHHLVSEVRCTLRPDWSLAEVIAAVFPGGSVTGAPKRRTVEHIERLEQRVRGIYCGAIVALTPDGLRCSIPIRTGVADAAGLWLQSGGGIVIDSDPEAERRECWAKMRAFERE
ncbi:chorismate-binding protein [Nannocystis bainbridge]|uniref:Anthranilate synthase component I family protein n=1 Tax=Nannocystis bainbridge TaxID=2995303 RepID=A0ABT5E0B3_9BACT|nr:anthranilate synthase component I family protein [Nannocystis bainbridge]MDC0719317.1 anthranilate synthase component I family protein [Nannocystis bainbridge]